MITVQSREYFECDRVTKEFSTTEEVVEYIKNNRRNYKISLGEKDYYAHWGLGGYQWNIEKSLTEFIDSAKKIEAAKNKVWEAEIYLCHPYCGKSFGIFQGTKEELNRIAHSQWRQYYATFPRERENDTGVVRCCYRGNTFIFGFFVP